MTRSGRSPRGPLPLFPLVSSWILHGSRKLPKRNRCAGDLRRSAPERCEIVSAFDPRGRRGPGAGHRSFSPTLASSHVRPRFSSICKTFAFFLCLLQGRRRAKPSRKHGPCEALYHLSWWAWRAIACWECFAPALARENVIAVLFSMPFALDDEAVRPARGRRRMTAGPGARQELAGP
jgi:hypothetical protein